MKINLQIDPVAEIYDHKFEEINLDQERTATLSDRTLLDGVTITSIKGKGSFPLPRFAEG